ncbi:hypothetical protein [Hymenobacter negativus]|uniref:Uncharacterized protein n=1 Tax=Hymenobacter negativus TaxID=2795026 RepID=A0ABS3QNP7_9BACT|nr:hypothetical protein [Hymenobacter negativus]MBO2012905.1 hypothetical protein [Hymenobacter negativus]
MKAISPTLHGVLDYGTCAFLALAPSLLNLQGTYATVCYVLAAGYLVISLLTNMPLGAPYSVPYPRQAGVGERLDVHRLSLAVWFYQ